MKLKMFNWIQIEIVKLSKKSLLIAIVWCLICVMNEELFKWQCEQYLQCVKFKTKSRLNESYIDALNRIDHIIQLFMMRWLYRNKNDHFMIVILLSLNYFFTFLIVWIKTLFCIKMRFNS